jgi:hypothetical protein
LSNDSADHAGKASLTSKHAVFRTFIEHEHDLWAVRLISSFDHLAPVASLTIV